MAHTYSKHDKEQKEERGDGGSPFSSPHCSGDLSFPVKPAWILAQHKMLVPLQGDALSDEFCVYLSHWGPQCAEAAGIPPQASPKIVVAIATSGICMYFVIGDYYCMNLIDICLLLFHVVL
ncbi:hypothetical protein EON64_20720 [archaeon]|nr:MAG: hypothetical protein EON64_20720 [archaeon]